MHRAIGSGAAGSCRNRPWLANFAERTAAVRESVGKIWAQEVLVNNAIPVGKHPRFMPNGTYAPLETALVQINAWLPRCYEGR